MSVYQRARDAITGRFVTIAYALAHPKTTVIQALNKIRS